MNSWIVLKQSGEPRPILFPYRPSKIKTPAAIARMLKMMPRPPRAATNGMRPVKINQIANKIMPTAPGEIDQPETWVMR
jgi:hypothetical protein